MNSSPSDLMSYCSWAKKYSEYRKSIGDYFYGDTLYYRNFYAFSHTIGDALKEKNSFENQCLPHTVLLYQNMRWDKATILLLSFCSHEWLIKRRVYFITIFIIFDHYWVTAR